MVKIIEFNATSYLTQSTDINPGEANLLRQGKGSRYEVSSVEDVGNGFKELKIPLKPGGIETWYVQTTVVNELNFSKPEPLAGSTPPAIIEFNQDSYLKRSPNIQRASSTSSGNAIFQGKGAKYEVFLRA